mmetsp:Transcript_7825/g.12426  ORF Transcript_7825/g.12426 Transcript_7825/m.12426 type:complete len:232 (-) Transcript_7825:1741-2436(-)
MLNLNTSALGHIVRSALGATVACHLCPSSSSYIGVISRATHYLALLHPRQGFNTSVYDSFVHYYLGLQLDRTFLLLQNLLIKIGQGLPQRCERPFRRLRSFFLDLLLGVVHSRPLRKLLVHALHVLAHVVNAFSKRRCALAQCLDLLTQEDDLLLRVKVRGPPALLLQAAKPKLRSIVVSFTFIVAILSLVLVLEAKDIRHELAVPLICVGLPCLHFDAETIVIIIIIILL